MPGPRFDQAIAAIDAANAGDPNEIVIDGVARPKEQAHAELMSHWVRALDPDADELQLLAARAHHLQRWAIPRHDYPEGRSGYLRWRTALKQLHADAVARIMADAGYLESQIERVQRIVKKQGLDSDRAVQVHEDALCLVFLATQYDELIERLGADKAVAVVAKTVKKMSAAGVAMVARVELSPLGSEVLARALAEA